MPRVTLKQIADAVGVSPATVSNAYDPARHGQLSAELRERIHEVATSLGFTGPDPTARALRVGQVNAVGVQLSERLSYAFSDPFAVEFLSGVIDEIEFHGLSVMLVPLAEDARQDDQLAAVRRAGIDALALLTLQDDHPGAQIARSRGIRLVLNNVTNDPDDRWVVVDDHRAGTLMGEHLTGLGHRDVVVVAATPVPAGTPGRALDLSEIDSPGISARLAGLAELVQGRLTVVTGGHNSFESGRSAAAWALEHRHDATAMVGLSDVLALGGLDELRRRGISVPGDWSVVGFDDVDAAGRAKLTTVRQPIRLRGRHVGRLLRDPTSEPRQVVLPVSLVVRDTAGPSRTPTREDWPSDIS